MSDSAQEGTKRCGSISESPTDPKKFKECHSIKEESESSSEVRLSEEELKLCLAFEENNFIINIGGKKLHVRKEHLVSASPVFDKMLNSDFKEAKQTEIQLPVKDVGNFARFLRYILPGFTDELKENTVHDMVPLAEEYQTEDLKQRIDIFLAKSVKEKGDRIRSDEIVNNLLEAQLYKLSRYLDQCISIAARKLSLNLSICQGYHDLSKDTILQIYTKRCNTIDACLKKGEFVITKTRVKPENSILPFGNNQYVDGSIYVKMRKLDGEKLQSYLQKN